MQLQKQVMQLQKHIKQSTEWKRNLDEFCRINVERLI